MKITDVFSDIFILWIIADLILPWFTKGGESEIEYFWFFKLIKKFLKKTKNLNKTEKATGT